MPIGWWDLADSALFYPDDMPAEWRLTYFANAFTAVLVPWSSWCDAGVEAIVAWREDVHSGFRFYLEQPPAGVACPGLAHAVDGLGDALAGWVAPLGAGEGAVLSCAETPGVAEVPSAGYAVRVPPDVRGNWRAARRWIEDLAAAQGAAPRLLILSEPTSAELSAWHDLLQLLGPARVAARDPEVGKGSPGSA